MPPLWLLLFATALALNAASPGPSVLALVSRVVTRGWRDVLPFLAAMWIGEVLWLTLAVAGLSAVAAQFETLFHILRYAGIAYLGWLAWKMWHRPVAVEPGELPTRGSRMAMFATGMALTLGNPKIVVFYVALLPSLVDLGAADLSTWALLAITTFLVLAAVDLSWVVVAERVRGLIRTPRAQRLANRIGAAAMGGAALAIASR